MDLDWASQELTDMSVDSNLLEFTMTGNTEPNYDKANPNAHANAFENPQMFDEAWNHHCP